MKARFPEGWGGRWAGQMEWTGDMRGHSVWGGGAASGLRLAGGEMEEKHGVTLGSLPGVQAREGLPA